MSRNLRSFVGLALAGVVAFPVAVFADGQDTIDYRRHIMKTMGEQLGAIGQILKGTIPADSFATHAEILALNATTAKKAFEPKVLGGDAKPELWENWADFSKRLDTLAAATAEFAKLAKAGGVAAAGPKAQETFTCKGCHDKYRQEKEKEKK